MKFSKNWVVFIITAVLIASTSVLFATSIIPFLKEENRKILVKNYTPKLEYSFYEWKKYLQPLTLVRGQGSQPYFKVIKYHKEIGELRWYPMMGWKFHLKTSNSFTYQLYPWYKREKRFAFEEGSLKKMKSVPKELIEKMVLHQYQDEGVPWQVTFLQYCLESNCGMSRKARELKNPFGIKCFEKTHNHKELYAKRVLKQLPSISTRYCENKNKDDHLHDFFKKFKSFEQALQVHSSLIKRRKNGSKRYTWFCELPFNSKITTMELKGNYPYVNWMGIKLKRGTTYSFENKEWWFIGLCSSGYATSRDYAESLFHRYNLYFEGWKDSDFKSFESDILKKRGVMVNNTKIKEDSFMVKYSGFYIPILITFIILLFNAFWPETYTQINMWISGIGMSLISVELYKVYIRVKDTRKQKKSDVFIEENRYKEHHLVLFKALSLFTLKSNFNGLASPFILSESNNLLKVKELPKYQHAFLRKAEILSNRSKELRRKRAVIFTNLYKNPSKKNFQIANMLLLEIIAHEGISFKERMPLNLAAEINFSLK